MRATRPQKRQDSGARVGSDGIGVLLLSALIGEPGGGEELGDAAVGP